VVVRIRPPLPREKSGHIFKPIVEVSPDQKSVSIMEYLGQEYEEKARLTDIESNPYLKNWKSYGFDYVYDQDST
jgi:hypothetical protein